MQPAAIVTNLAILTLTVGLLVQPVAAQDQDPRKDATAATKAANAALLNELPFSDRSDFENARRGLIAPLPAELIKGQAGNPIWDSQKYGFIAENAAAPDTVNPSLWRQSQLINISG